MEMTPLVIDAAPRPRRWWGAPRVHLPHVPGLGAVARLVRRAARRGGSSNSSGARAAATATAAVGGSAAVTMALSAAAPEAPAAPAAGVRLPRGRSIRTLAPAFASLSTTRPALAGGTPGAARLSAAPRRAAAAASKPATRPASDVLAGALARAASQSIIHPLDTLKVQLQANMRARGGSSGGGSSAAPPAAPKPPAPAAAAAASAAPAAAAAAQLRAARAGVAGLYRGVVGAASGAGIAIGAYFAFYSAACNVLAAHTDLSAGGVAFFGGAAAAAGSSVVKVPLAVCIRSVQAGVYPNAFAAAAAITRAAGPRGLFTGYWPTLLEDVPDMACKFAAYESMRQLHRRLTGGRDATPGEDFAMGALAGAAAAAATTPLDVVKTRMMCTAAARPTMAGAAAAVMAAGGPGAFFAGVGPRALSNGINSAVFFCAFEAIRSALQRPPAAAGTEVVAAESVAEGKGATA